MKPKKDHDLASVLLGLTTGYFLPTLLIWAGIIVLMPWWIAAIAFAAGVIPIVLPILIASMFHQNQSQAPQEVDRDRWNNRTFFAALGVGILIWVLQQFVFGGGFE